MQTGPSRTTLAAEVIVSVIDDPALRSRAARFAATTNATMERRLPMLAYYELWEDLLAHGMAPEFPAEVLRLRRLKPDWSPNPVRIFARSRATVGEAMTCVERYWPLVTDAYQLVAEVDLPAPRLSFSPVPSRAGARADVLFSMAAITSHALEWSATETVSHVELRDPASRYRRAELEAALGCEARFDCSVDALILRPGATHVELRHRDESIDSYLRPILDTMLEHCRRTISATGKVWNLLAAGEDSRALQHFTHVARALGTSTRTLRRALAEEGTSYVRLREQYREHKANQWLSTASDAEIARRLGYADEVSFRRAFLRWNGTTPRVRRKSLALEPGP